MAWTQDHLQVEGQISAAGEVEALKLKVHKDLDGIRAVYDNIVVNQKRYTPEQALEALRGELEKAAASVRDIATGITSDAEAHAAQVETNFKEKFGLT